MSELLAEIRKIPPVTRFICGSTVAVTLPVMLKIISPYTMIFVKELVTKRREFWRIYTSFFIGESGINFIFDMAMQYRNTGALESYYDGRSADLAWQLLFASASIIALNIPLGTFVHTRALMVAITYVSGQLSPPGTQTSLWGVVSFPVRYFAYALVAIDFVIGGKQAAMSALTGIIVGHLWWWGVWESRALQEFGKAPGWMRSLIDTMPSPGPASGAPGGSFSGSRRSGGRTTGYNWGSGRRLGRN